jgi:hypothetical protein
MVPAITIDHLPSGQVVGQPGGGLGSLVELGAIAPFQLRGQVALAAASP